MYVVVVGPFLWLFSLTTMLRFAVLAVVLVRSRRVVALPMAEAARRKQVSAGEGMVWRGEGEIAVVTREAG